MKKIAILVILIMSLLLTSCAETKENIEDGYVTGAPYVVVDEEKAEQQVKTIDWEKVLANIPSDKYDEYKKSDFFSKVPTSATLYKNGDVIDIDIMDKRLVKLMNFYNNAVYHDVISYTQGTCTKEYEESLKNPFILELTFEFPNEPCGYRDYCLKMLISDIDFFLVCNEVDVDGNSYYATADRPLYSPVRPWLEVFGF